MQNHMDGVNSEINELKKVESELASRESKLDEEIKTHKASKKFLDLIAIASKIKKPVNQKKRARVKAMNEAANDDLRGNAHNERGSSTFITQGARGTGPIRKQNTLKDVKKTI